MFFNERLDHIPHFHAYHAGRTASFAIEEPRCIEGHLHPRAEKMVLEWARQHGDELLNNYIVMRNDNNPQQIEPLQ